mgnify:FL=1|tara:strand:- start:3282 stop:5216 length:1935 start_codon:yes stop_codon:yes gene_type:complete
MAPKQTLSQGLINQLVPRSSLGRDFTTKLNQLRGDQQEALNILGFKDYTGSLGPSDTLLGKGAKSLTEGALNIPFAVGELFKDISLPFQAGEAGVTALLKSLVDPLQTERGRKKAAEKMAVGTSGLELGLPIDTTVPRGQLGPNPIIGQTLKEREDALRNLREKKSEIDEFAIGTGKDESVKTTEGADVTSSPKFTDPTAEAAQEAADKEEALASSPDEDLDYTDTYTEEELKAVNDPEVKKKAAQAELFTSAMKEIEDIYGDDSEPKKRKTIDDYKADFARATGIDISGEPDNKSALMALGLSLMQNRAGKGFNLSNILGEVGAAGQAALPKFEEARKEARAAQVAAGKFALQEQKADQKAALALAKEKRTALAAVSKEFRGYANKQQLEYLKHRNNMEIKLLENDMKPIDAKGKVTTQTLEGNNFLKVDTAFVTGSRNRVFLAPVQQAKQHANQYVNVLEASNSINEVKSILQDLGKANDATAIGLLKDRVLSVLKPLGIGDTDYSKGVAEIIDKGTNPEQKVRAIQDRLISQYKKFLTKETGNGVSEGDIKRLQQLIGEIKIGQPLSENLNRLDQLSQIFAAPQRAIESQLNAFSKRENYRNDDEYNKTMAILNKAIRTGTDGTYNLNVNEDGVINIDLTK